MRNPSMANGFRKRRRCILCTTVRPSFPPTLFLAPSSPAFTWWGKIFLKHESSPATPTDKEFLKFLKAREAFMRGLIKRLEKAVMEDLATPWRQCCSRLTMC